MSCLNGVIGLSQTTCNCPAFASKPTDTSMSGYYIDDEIPIDPLVYADCGQGNIWDILTRARTKAISDFEADFNAELQKVYKQRTAPFVGEIGTKGYSGIITSASRYCGLRIDTKAFKGSKLAISSLMIGNNLGGATTIKVWRGYSVNNVTVTNIEQIYSQSATLLANQFTTITLSTPQEFTLKQNEHYFITYDLPTGSYPFSNQLPTCGGCTGTNVGWRDSLNVNGLSVANESEINTGSYGTSAYGLIINAKIYCDVSGWVCTLKDLGTVSGEFRTVAKALVFKAAQNAVQVMLDSSQINFTTITSRENLYGKRNHFAKEYADRIAWLASVFPISEFNCLTCGGANTIRVQSILV